MNRTERENIPMVKTDSEEDPPQLRSHSTAGTTYASLRPEAGRAFANSAGCKARDKELFFCRRAEAGVSHCNPPHLLQGQDPAVCRIRAYHRSPPASSRPLRLARALTDTAVSADVAGGAVAHPCGNVTQSPVLALARHFAVAAVPPRGALCRNNRNNGLGA